MQPESPTDARIVDASTQALLDKARSLFSIPSDHTPYITLGTDERAILLEDSLPFLRDRELLIIRWNLDSPSVKRISAAGGLPAQGGARKVRFGADTKEQENEWARKTLSASTSGQQGDASSPRDKGKAVANNGSPPQIRQRGEKSSSADDQLPSSSAERGSPTMKAGSSKTSSSSSSSTTSTSTSGSPANKLQPQPSLPLATGAPGSIGYSSANRQAHAHRTLQETRERIAIEEAEVKLQQQLAKEQEENARREAEEKALREAREEEARAKEEARRREQARQEAEDKARAEEEARREAEAKARHEEEEKARREAEEKARLETEEKARLEAAEEARLAGEEKSRLEAEKNARLEAEMKARLEAEEKTRLRSEEEARLEAEEDEQTHIEMDKSVDKAVAAIREKAAGMHKTVEQKAREQREAQLSASQEQDLGSGKARTVPGESAPVTRRSGRVNGRKQPQPKPSRASRQRSGPSQSVKEHPIIIISSDNESQEEETRRPLTRAAKKVAAVEPVVSAKAESPPARVKLAVVICTGEEADLPILKMGFEKQDGQREEEQEQLRSWSDLEFQIGACFMDLEDRKGVLIDTVQTSNHELWASRSLQGFFERSRINHETLNDLDLQDAIPVENPAVARYLQRSRTAVHMPAFRRTPSSEITVVPSSSPLAKLQLLVGSQQEQQLKDGSSLAIAVQQLDEEEVDEEMAVCAALSSQDSASSSADPSPSPKKRVRAEEKWSARKRSTPAATPREEEEAVSSSPKQVGSSPKRASVQDGSEAEPEAVREAYTVASKVIEALRLHPANTAFQQPMSAEYVEFCEQRGEEALGEYHRRTQAHGRS